MICRRLRAARDVEGVATAENGLCGEICDDTQRLRDLLERVETRAAPGRGRGIEGIVGMGY